MNFRIFKIILFTIYFDNAFSQTIDVDSLFIVNTKFQEFISNLPENYLEQVPNWDSIFEYKNINSISLKMAMYKGQSNLNLKPTIILFHGGGWQNGTYNKLKKHAYYFSLLGYNSFSVQYRLINDSLQITPYDCLKDAKSAVRYIRKNYLSLFSNPEKIVCYGSSAGGHLAASTAFIKAYNDEEDDSTISSIPNGLILNYPILDLSSEGWNFGHQYLGNEWLNLSPNQNIDSCQNIPSVVFSGTDDNTSPIINSLTWDKIYKSFNCKNYLYSFQGRIHSFSLYNPDFFYTLYLMRKFLIDEIYCFQGDFDCNLSINKIEKNTKKSNIKIYPNPTNFGNIYINNIEDCKIFIYDQFGNLVHVKIKKKFENNEIVIEDLIKGFYIIQIINQDHIITNYKVIVE